MREGLSSVLGLGGAGPVQPAIKALVALAPVKNRQGLIQGLMAHFGDGAGGVRRDALEAAGKVGDSSAISAVQRALGDSWGLVVDAAEETLERLIQVSSAALLAQAQEAQSLLEHGVLGPLFSSQIHVWLVGTLQDMALLEPDQLRALTQLLDWPYWEVRASAIRGLRSLRPTLPDAVLERLMALRHDGESLDVRRAADDTLGELLSLETGIEDA